MKQPTKIGQLVKFRPDRFDYSLLRDHYSAATISETFKVVKIENLDGVEDDWGGTTSWVNISPIANPSVQINGLYATRFFTIPLKISKTKPIKD